MRERRLEINRYEVGFLLVGLLISLFVFTLKSAFPGFWGPNLMLIAWIALMSTLLINPIAALLFRNSGGYLTIWSSFLATFLLITGIPTFIVGLLTFLLEFFRR